MGQAADLAAHLEPGNVRKTDVEEHEVRAAVADRVEGVGTGGDGVGGAALAFEQGDEVGAQGLFVLDDQLTHASPPFAGER